jgi:hypothetical protein
MVAFNVRQAAFEDRQGAFEQHQAATDRRLEQLVESVSTLNGKVDWLAGRVSSADGALLELRYADHLDPWFGLYLQKVRRLQHSELTRVELAKEQGLVSDREANRLRSRDMFVQGVEKPGDGSPILYAAELSFTINTDDVERAEEAAETLRRSGYAARSFVGGYRVTQAAADLAERFGTVVDLQTTPGGYPDAAAS